MKQMFNQYGKMILALVIVCISLIILYGAGGSGGVISQIGSTFYKDESGQYNWEDNGMVRLKNMSSASDPTVTLTTTGAEPLYTNTPYTPATLFNVANAKGQVIQLGDTNIQEAQRSFIDKIVDSYDGADVTTSVITYGSNGIKDIRYLTFPENHKYYIYFRVYDGTSNRNCDIKTSISFKKAGLFREDGTIIYNWQQLKDNHAIAVDSNGVLTGGANKASLNGVLLIDDEVKTVAANAFSGCTSITNITVPESVKTINENAFNGCTGLTNLGFTEGLQKIGESAFNGCTGLTSIFLPTSVREIGTYAFENCSNLFNVTYKDTVYELRTDLEAALRASGVSLVNTAFNKTAMNGATLASGIYGSDRSFKSWQQLKDEGYIAVDGNGMLNSDSTKAVTLSGELVIDPEVKSIYDSPNDPKGVFSQCTKLTNIVFPNTITSLGGNAFWQCTGLKSITVPDSVTTIYDDAFVYCSGLESIKLSDNITEVYGYVFMECRNLKNVTISNKVTRIQRSAFATCTSLETFTLPDNIQQIDAAAFKGCTSLKSITFNGTTYTSKKALLSALSDRKVTVASNAFDEIGMVN